MLTDWESRDLPAGRVRDMSPRHYPERKFRPERIHARRDPETHKVLILKIGGPTVFNGQPDRTVWSSWEWDATRDPHSILGVAELITEFFE